MVNRSFQALALLFRKLALPGFLRQLSCLLQYRPEDSQGILVIQSIFPPGFLRLPDCRFVHINALMVHLTQPACGVQECLAGTSG